jgi:hypothetical protein
MKYLEIKYNKGYYWNDKEMVEIDQINKVELLKLINHAEEDEFEMDVYDENQLQNKAHQIIYQSIYTKLNDFLADKEQFNREVDVLYAEAIGEYGADVELETSEEDIEEVEDAEEENDINSDDIPF